MFAPSGFSFVESLFPIAKKTAEDSSLMQRLKGGESSVKPISEFCEPKETPKRSVPQPVIEEVHPTTLRDLIAGYLVEKFLLEESTEIFIFNNLHGTLSVSKSILDWPTKHKYDDLDIAFDDLWHCSYMLSAFAYSRPSRYPKFDTDRWWLKSMPNFECLGDASQNETLISISPEHVHPLLISERDKPSSETLNTYLHPTWLEDFFLEAEKTMHQKGGRPKKIDRYKRVLRILYGPQRPDATVEDMRRSTQKYLMQSEGVAEVISVRSFRRALEKLGWTEPFNR
ncbi:hypothetical protein GS634_08135 [Ruegeria atlantica]|uniref:Uncharacterized protein n=1 Tax=Ruegeria atlantica TaxID=81569 RepID=A0AA90YSI2_9RHOB|nr:hypothetical protein [Ruegeria atlantica]NOE18091.1 hypothetical protein [Ruegeria atlantica]